MKKMKWWSLATILFFMVVGFQTPASTQQIKVDLEWIVSGEVAVVHLDRKNFPGQIYNAISEISKQYCILSFAVTTVGGGRGEEVYPNIAIIVVGSRSVNPPHCRCR